jgi:hypothetical protein
MSLVVGQSAVVVAAFTLSTSCPVQLVRRLARGDLFMAIEDLRQSPMMSHILDALDNGEDIGHYGRLVFAMIGRHFVTNDELVELLTKDRDADEGEIRALVQQVEEKGYSPPRREKILEYQSQQDFPICPDPDDPDACNPYAELQFPDEVYEGIREYREERT